MEDLCFDAQQAAEKALKAVLLKQQGSFPYTHDLADLVTLLKESDEEIPDAVKQAGRLTRFAVVTRYPGVIEPVTEEEHLEAVATAEAVVQWVEKQLGEQA